MLGGAAAAGPVGAAAGECDDAIVSGPGGDVVSVLSLAGLVRWTGCREVPYDRAASTYWLLLAIAVLAGAVYGYGLSLSPLLDDIAASFADEHGTPLSTGWREVVSGAAPLGGVLVSPVIGLLSDRTGRLWVLIASCSLFCAGMVLSFAAHTLWVLLVARFIVGVGMAMVLFAAPCYISENADMATSELLVGVLHMLFSFGFALFCGIVLAVPHHWRAMLLSGCAPGGMMLVFAVLFLPESIGWKLGRRRALGADRSLPPSAASGGVGADGTSSAAAAAAAAAERSVDSTAADRLLVNSDHSDVALDGGSPGARQRRTQRIGWWRALWAGNLLAICNASDKPLVYYAAQIFKQAVCML